VRTGRLLLAPALAVATAAALVGAFTIAAGTAQAATTTLCSSQAASVAAGAYMVENNEWNSSASECVTTDGNADFSVANSAISNATNGAPGGYPAIYDGCHWGSCSTGAGLPLPVGNLTPGAVTTSWNTTQTGTGAYDVAYDIWFNQTPTTTGQPDAEELMVWLNHNGSVQPSGSVVASNVSIGGHTYNIWEAQDSVWKDVSYVMTSGTTSVSNLDVGLLAADSVSRGYMNDSDYLIDVEAGFELWQGGAGLATNSFSVNVNGSGSTTPPPTSPPTTTPPTTTPPTTAPPTTTPPTNPAGKGGCSAAYSVTSSWPGGYQAQVVITDTGSTAISGWTASWTYPGDQEINNLWNGEYTQSGKQVTVTNASYDGSLNPGGSTTVGFTGTFTSNDTTPSSAACTVG
jgi:Glycosyl hydrolase family 12/Cellulose binding domain